MLIFSSIDISYQFVNLSVGEHYFLISRNVYANNSQMQTEFKPYRSQKIRFLLLFLVSMVVFGNQYAFNNPQALEVYMEEDLDIGQTQFQLLYTIFAFPNIFATFFLGFLIDFLGVRIGIVALTIGVVIFQLVIAIGGYMYSYTTILIGRMLFGLSSVSLITAQASMVTFWFKGKQLALALGIAVTFPELGNALNSYITPIIYESSQSLGTPLLTSVFICLISLTCAILAAYLDKKADTYDEEHKIVVHESATQNVQNQKEQIKLKDIKKLTWTFWLLVLLCMFAVGLYIPFMDGANKLLVERFCFTPVTSGRALVVTYLVAAFSSPIVGLIVDKFGHKRYMIMGCMGIFMIAQLIIFAYPQCEDGAFPEKGAITGLVLIGLGYSFYGNCIVPSISQVVKRKITGTAFGIMQMIQSIVLAAFPLINGALIENGQKNPESTSGYRNSSLFFFLVGIVGVLTSIGLFFIPEKFKHKLDKSSRTKMKLEHGQNGELIYSATESETSHDQDVRQSGKTIQITNQTSSENIRISLLNDAEKKQVNYDL